MWGVRISIHVSIRLLASALDVTGVFDLIKHPLSVRVIFCRVLDFPIHVSIRLLGSALDVTVGFDFFKNPMSVRVIFCLPLAKNCIENGITGI